MSGNYSGEFDHFKLKEDFRDYLRNQDIFKGFNFDGTNIDALLDVLAYNTNLNAFMHNMVGTESNLKSAQQRDNVLGHVFSLNYVARSYKAAKAVIDLEIVVADVTTQTVNVPKGTIFSGVVDGAVYQFQTIESYSVNRIANRFILKGIPIVEGKPVRELFRVKNVEPNQSFTISNSRIDISTLDVNVLAGQTATVKEPYSRAFNLYDLSKESKVYFLQNALDNKYEIVFGDDIFGKKLAINNVVEVTYLVTSGPVVNGVSRFTASQQLVNGHRMVVTTITPAQDGAPYESNASIKHNAPRYFQAQERAIISDDYKALIQREYNDIGDINVFGGESLTEPQYGKIFIVAITSRGNSLSDTRKQEILNFLADKKNPDQRVTFIDPDILEIVINATIRYNPSRITVPANTLKTKVIDALRRYGLQNFNKFDTVMRYSKLVEFIDSIDPSIVSNETSIQLLKTTPIASYRASQTRVDFRNPIRDMYTSTFNMDGSEYVSRDDGKGILRLFSQRTNELTTELSGTVNYSTGVAVLNSNSKYLYPQELIKAFATPKSFDIKANQNTIAQFNLALSNITIESA